MKKLPFIKIMIEKPFIDRRDWVKYLTLSEFQTKIIQKQHPEILETVPNERFTGFLQTEIGKYLDGKEIDKEIASAVMNCADMYASGEPVTLRAGDYIALQTYHQKTVKK